MQMSSNWAHKNSSAMLLPSPQHLSSCSQSQLPFSSLSFTPGLPPAHPAPSFVLPFSSHLLSLPFYISFPPFSFLPFLTRVWVDRQGKAPHYPLADWNYNGRIFQGIPKSLGSLGACVEGVRMAARTTV